MTDETFDGPDANDVRRHAKKLYTEKQYRERYNRLEFYKPSPKQLEFHNLPANITEIFFQRPHNPARPQHQWPMKQWT